jgi:transcriptional regulator with XRE-family HTH domain
MPNWIGMKVQITTVLKRELKSRQMTIAALAKTCGIPVSVLHSWVGGVLPSARNLHHVAALAEHLELPVSVLLFDHEENKKESIVLFKSEFADGDHQYRLSVEKIRKDD